MFYFLLITGIIITALGIYIDKNTISEYFKGLNEKTDDKEMDYLESRIRELEKTLFSHSLAIQRYGNENNDGREANFQDEAYETENTKTLLSERDKIKSKLNNNDKRKEDLYEKGDQGDKKNESLIKYEKIREYEKDGKSIEDMCRELKMNKGEVLLLKKLYKDY